MKSGLSSRSREPSPGQLRVTGYRFWDFGLNLCGCVERKILGMADEPRILVYEGRRFLRPETGPKVEGTKEAGFENLPRLIISSVLVATFMIIGGIWFAEQIRSGAIAWDSPWKWLALVFTIGPIFLVIGLTVLAARLRAPIEKPDLPQDPVRLLCGFQPNQIRTRMTGSLELELGMIRVRNETQVVEINRLEVDQFRIVEGRIRLRVPKFHSLPPMYLLLYPLGKKFKNLADQKSALKELVLRLETMPTSTLASTYPAIERREFERPPGTLQKCVVAGVLVGLILCAVALAIRRPEVSNQGGDFLGWILMPVGWTVVITMFAFGDVWLAKLDNTWLRKKGIVRD
jgi:hypothetical protein